MDPCCGVQCGNGRELVGPERGLVGALRVETMWEVELDGKGGGVWVESDLMDCVCTGRRRIRTGFSMKNVAPALSSMVDIEMYRADSVGGSSAGGYG